MPMNTGRRMSLRDEGGQALIVMVMALTVMFVVGAITVDVGLWLSERRGSQTEADFSALAGAFQLIDPNATSNSAITAATDSLTANDQQKNASFANPVAVDNSCFNRSQNDAVTVDIKRDSKALFFGIFGVSPPDIGAHAKACVGSVNGPNNLVPFELSLDQSPCFVNGQPVLAKICWIAGGAQESNARGILDLNAAPQCSQNSGSGDLQNLITNGASGTCLINTTNSCSPARNGPWYDCVVGQSGNPDNPKITAGTNARVSRDGMCDQTFGNHDGIDSFEETVTKVFDTGDPATSIYAPRDCDPTQDGTQISPRLVTIIVVATNPGSGNDGVPIKAFAGVYIAGCVDERLPNPTQADLDPYCGDKQVMNLAPAAGGDELYVSAAQPGLLRVRKTPTLVATATPTPGPSSTPAPGSCVASGHCAVYGQIVNIILEGNGIGPPTDQTTAFGISLVQ